MVTRHKSKNIIFLYPELTSYFIGCINNFIENNPEIKIIIVFNKKFEKLELPINRKYSIVDKNSFQNKHQLLSFCIRNNPSLVLVSGRMYNEYLYVAKRMKKRTTVITVQDTIYQNSIKQVIIKLFSFHLYKKYFDKFWGVGSLQRKFALDIGFKSKDIYDGFYVSNKIFFDSKKKNRFSEKNLNFLFIGRLVKEKNILRLAKSIEQINNDRNSSHKLTIIGGGYLEDEIVKHKCVDFKGPMDQKNIIKIALKCDVFCLPSIYEPWGVVTHEMCAIGLPILISKNCGSIDLVEDGINGFVFNPVSNRSIKNAIEKYILLPKSKKKKFSLNSIKNANLIKHSNWNKTLLTIMNS